MRNAGKLVLGLIVLAVVAGCGTPELVVVSSDELAKVNLRIYWPKTLVLREEEGIRRIAFVEDALYCLTTDNRLISIDAATGVERWVLETPYMGSKVCNPIHVDNLRLSKVPPSAADMAENRRSPDGALFNATIVNTNTHIVILDRITGKIWRRIRLQDFATYASGASDGVYFYVGSDQGSYYAIAMDEGIKKWGLATRGRISAPVVYSQGQLFIGSEDSRFYSAATTGYGEMLWNQTLLGPVVARFAVDRDTCYVACKAGRLYAFDKMTGREVWNPVVFGTRLLSGVQMADRTLFQYAQGEGLYAISKNTGKIRWIRPNGQRVIGIEGEKIYMLTGDGMLVVLDELSGKVESSVELKGMSFFTLNTSNGTIFTGTSDGRIFCIRKR